MGCVVIILKTMNHEKGSAAGSRDIILKKGGRVAHAKRCQFVEHKDMKFRITYNNCNGSPQGFDYRFKAEMLSSDEGWVVIAGKSDIGFENCSYVQADNVIFKEAQSFFAEMRKHIELLY